MPAALFVVRAVVADPAKRAAFDDWYHREHLPDVIKALGAAKAWRFWSANDPSLHQAMYQVADRAALERELAGEVIRKLVGEFDRAFPEVPRTREILVLAEEYAAA
jgi:hypothetical protein